MTYGFNAATAIKTIITKLLYLPKPLPLNIYTDLKSLYECLIKLSTTQEKYLIIDLIYLRQLYKRYKIVEIKQISGDINPADAMIKSKPCYALKQFINTNKLYIEVSVWVEYLTILLTVCTLKYKNMAFAALISININQIDILFSYILSPCPSHLDCYLLLFLIISIHYLVSPNMYKSYPYYSYFSF